MRLKFELKGTMPLLMHQDDVEAADTLLEWRKDSKNRNLSKPGDDRSPGWTWMTYLYNDGTHLAMPSHNVSVCLRTAGTRMQLKGNKTYKELTQSGLLIPTEFCEFKTSGRQVNVSDVEALRDLPFDEQADLVRALGFKLFLKRANVNGKKHIRVRPRFDAWVLRGEIEVTAEREWTMDKLEELFSIAGRVGLGDWRPTSPKAPGSYGMFSASISKI